MSYRPLENIRVVDFTWAAMGPYGTQLLASLGAQVIKIGSAKQGGGMPAVRAEQVHNQLNYSKYSVAINLGDPAGVDVARRLIAVSDVVTENFRPGTLQKYGLDYQSLVRFHRDLVMVSASLWGQRGAYARYAAFAPVFGALAGLSAVAGLPNGIPTEMRMPMDYTGGLFIAYATLQGVLHRDRTGQGQHVDLSGRDTVAWMIGDVMMEAAVNGRDRPLVGNQDEAWAPHGAYACREPDTWISIAVTSDEEWQGLCREMKRDDLGQDPGYSDVYQRWQHREELDQQIAIWTRQHEPGYLTEVLQQAGVPAFPSFNARDIFQDPHLQERELFNTLSDGKGKSATVIAPPWRIDGERPQPTRKAPTLGQDMPWALGDLLGMDGDEIRFLEDKGVLM